MDSYICGIYSRSENILIVSYTIFPQYTHSRQILVHLHYVKNKFDKTRKLSDLVFIPQMLKSIDYCMTYLSSQIWFHNVCIYIYISQ